MTDEQPINRIVLTVPLPPKGLQPNHRVHWRVLRRATKAHKADVTAICLAALEGKRPQWKHAREQTTFFHRTAHISDPDNLQASMKAAYDGLQAAGLIENDRKLCHNDVIQHKDATNPRVEIEIWETANDGKD